MALQPQDDRTDLHNPNVFETSQYSQNITQDPRTHFSFITEIHDADTPIQIPILLNNDQETSIKESNGVDENFPFTSDIDARVEEIISNEKFDTDDMPFSSSMPWILEELDKFDLEKIDRSIQDRIMTVESQPPTDIRRRYESDGKRQIEKSRSKPMTIKLPNLNTCHLKAQQSLWLQLTLITGNENPTGKAYTHVDKLEYHADDLPECGHGPVRVPLTPTDIQQGTKQLARISIIKKKLDAYSFELKPFNPTSTDNQIETYENTNAKSTVAKAKCFRETYHLKFSRIACQLLIKQDSTWHTTNIFCQTDIMEEKEKQINSKKASKRAVPSSDSDDEDEYQPDHRTSTKKRKQSSTSMNKLPVTRVKKL
ncbi:unnamed protein product [Adineta steineri]|uniref:Uncharacterized protein n=1 Tax=Adineta steineri TaxID=433720 RepID=A0A815B0T4_9BILA|nr:unnamed protein product [Adineta steineri]CAF4051961.1 unnamed protein product [Adineta steineri]